MNHPPLIRPASCDDLCAHIRRAADARHQVRIVGAGSLPLTRFDESRTVESLSMLRVNTILHHAPADMTVSLQAGCSLETLQRHLAWHNQWLPVDPPVITPCDLGPAAPARTPGTRTLGGLIASNSLGPLRCGCGDWRLFILGMTWIDARGRLIHSGGQTLKNVAGYASHRLMIGSCGSLGAIVQVTLRTFARPPDEKAILFFCDSPQRAETLLNAILLAPTNLAFLQVIGAATFSSNPLNLPAPPGGLIVAAGFLGHPEPCVAQMDILRNLPAAAGFESIAQTAAQSGRLRLWMASEPSIPDPHALGFRIHTTSSQVAAIIAAIEQRAHDTGAPSWALAEASGTVRGYLGGPDPTSFLTQLTTSFQTQCLITQGAAPSAVPHPLALRLKQQLDPDGIFGNDPGITAPERW